MSDLLRRIESLSPKRAALMVLELQEKLEALERDRAEPIAIIGMACRFPGGANDLDSFWELLEDGRNAVCEVPPERWDADAWYHPDPDVPGRMSTRWGGFLDRVDEFDAPFFGISRREAIAMDPQQRLLLEVSWEALEHAGHAGPTLLGTQTGVYLGITTSDYQQFLLRQGHEKLDTYVGTGQAHSIAAGRVSYSLGLHGPNLALDTACSSSSVAIHLACQALRMNECRMALAGGVNMQLGPLGTVILSKAHMMSADGRCKAFDASADGFVRGEGCGILVLKRLSAAREDGDNVLAVIRGTAVNQDGRSSGIMAPNGRAQEEVVRLALASGNVDPREVSYVEAHGTGTGLGDPIEAHALAAVLGHDRDEPLRIGSVKTNIGHLEATAGVAGLIKVVLALRNERIPRSLHFERLNPHIDFGAAKVEVAAEPLAWPKGERPRIAGVSSFGFSGTNAHLLVEEAPEAPERERGRERPLHVLTLSGRSPQALATLRERYAEHLERSQDVDLGDLCFTANAGREHFTHRAAFVAATAEEMVAGLRGRPAAEGATTAASEVAFLYTGQGAQYAGMGRELAEASEVFAEALDRCCRGLDGALGERLEEVLWGGRTELLDETAYTQVALFAVEYALSQLWRSFGVRPAAVLGHSVGEYAAAVEAGVLTLEDGLGLIAERGRLMGSLPPGGAMAAALASEAEVRAAIGGREGVWVAAVNGAENVTISGEGGAVAEVAARLEAAGVRVKPLAVSHAFHSGLMEPIEEAFERRAARAEFSRQQVALISSVTGERARDEELADAGYWRRQVREPVRFADALATAERLGFTTFLEIGPGTTLVGLGRANSTNGSAAWVPSLRKGRGEWRQLLEAVAELHVRGVGVDWSSFDAPYSRRRVPLPTYPFERQRYWIVAEGESDLRRPHRPVDIAAQGHPLLGRPVRSPLTDKTIFDTVLSTKRVPFLADHLIDGTPVFPMTAYLETVAAAIEATSGFGSRSVAEMNIRDVLAVEEGVEKPLQVLLGADTFEVYSRDGDAWTLHASGALGAPAPHVAEERDLDAIRSRLEEGPEPEALYAKLRGVEYGEGFRTIAKVWIGERESLGLLRLTPAFAAQTPDFFVHPALLDGSIQVLGTTLGDKDVYLPIGIERYQVFGRAGSEAWVYGALRPDTSIDDEVIAGDIFLMDGSGRTLAAVEGLTLKRASAEVLARIAARRVDEWIYELDWQPKPLDPGPADASGDWLLVADEGGAADALAARLEQAGGRCTVVRDGEIERALAGAYWRGVVHMASLDLPASEELTVERLEEAERRACGGVLRLVQALAERGGAEAPQLVLVTRGAQEIDGKQKRLAVAQSPLWGMARVVALEHPDLRCRRIDLDPEADAGEALAREVVSGDAEDQVALRGGGRFVARLVRRRPDPPADRPARLAIGTKGLLDSLAFQPCERRAPGPGEIEMRVAATGLNFRDVLNAMGMYPGEAGPMGSECSGTVVAVGPGVDRFAVGDPVLALAGGSFASYVTVDARQVERVPAGVTWEEAVTLPIVFLTSHYALNVLGKLKPGDRVLIHAAAGGIGLSAIQLARRAGAEIYATASTQEKHAYVRSLGVEHVYSSRTLDFAARILEETGGRGVDVVLNSLSGEFIDASFSALAHGGRFLEIGKIGIWDHDRVAALGKDVDYHVIDLGTVILEDLPLLGRMFRELVEAVEAGELRPLPLRAFPMEDAEAAFRYMAQARHIGKIVIKQNRGALELRDAATYLLTGGLGGLGLKVAEEMVRRGARHLALVGRRAPAGEAAEAVARLEAAGARVRAFAADVASRDDMAALLAEVEATMPPLRGVVHAAGVLDDGALVKQDWERFARVMAPKVTGTWLLHELTASRNLDFFVLFSSVASLIGSAGQGNYASANAFMDAVAHERRSQGLPALSINWGPWAEVGMAAALERSRGGRSGSALSPADGVQAFGRLVAGAAAQVGVIPFDLRELRDYNPAYAATQLFAALVSEAAEGEAAAAAAAGEALDAVAAAAPEARLEAVESYLRERLAEVLYLTPEQVSPESNAFELGLDSIMVMTVIGEVERDLRVKVAPREFFNRPQLRDLAGYVLEEVVRVHDLDSAPAAEEPAAAAVAEPETLAAARASAEAAAAAGEPAAAEAAVLAGAVEIAAAPPAGEQTAFEPVVTVPAVLAAGAARDADMPLSYGQQRLWFLDRFEPGSSLYILPAGSAVLDGPLDVEALQHSIGEIVRRHEVLRTTFPSVDGRPVQRVHAAEPVALPIVDLTDLEPERREAEAMRLAAEEYNRPFDLAAGPLLRATLLRLEPERHVLVMPSHHIVSDGWSVGVFCSELSALYEAFTAGRPSPLPELPMQYADYAVWQREYVESEVVERQMPYWRDQLGGDLPPLELPTDRQRPPVSTYAGAVERMTLPPRLLGALRSLGKSHGGTLYMVLLAAFQALLSRHSGQEDIAVGSPVAGRTRPETQGLLGFFVNTLVMRTDLSGDPTFRDLLARVRDVAVEAFAHQDVPFERLVEELQPRRSLNRNPLFQAALVVYNVTPAALRLRGLEARHLEVDLTTSQFDLSLAVNERESGLACEMTYSTDLFDAATIRRMLEHFEVMLEAVVDDPTLRLSELPLMKPEERRLVVEEWNRTGADYPARACVHHLVEQQVERTPEAAAVECDGRRLTYRELNERANRLAHRLQELGAGPDELVAVCMERSLEMVVALLGVLKSGAAYVPVDPAYPSERVAFMLEDARAKVVVTQRSLAAALPEHGASTVLLDAEWRDIALRSDSNPESAAGSGSLAYVIYTSGSTGRPKGVAVEHRSVVALLHWARGLYDDEDLAGVLASTSICFDISVFELFVPLAWGGRLVVARDALALREMPASAGVTLVNTVPSAMAELVRAGALPASARVVNLAGEALSRDLADRVYETETVSRVYNLYGPTEDTVYSTWELVDRDASDAPPIGRPVANTRAYVLDARLEPAPIGVVGELYLAGAGLARGYLRRERLTAERFPADPFSAESGARMYRTGDLARYRGDGRLEYLGRVDHQVKVRGFRIELGEIESVLREHDDVREAVVVAREDAPGDKRLVAYVTAEAGREVDAEALRDRLRAKLPDYMVPAAIVRLAALPLTANGKTDRKALPAPDYGQLLAEGGAAAPRDTLEVRLVKMWESMLNVSPIGIKDDFFALGGHSLLAVQLFARIEKVFDKRLPLATLFEAPTIERLADILRQDGYSPKWSSLVAIQPNGTKPPFFCVHAAGVNVLFYRDLAVRLGPDQPVYGLQPQGLDGTRPRHTRVEDMAAHYIEEMKSVQPHGPYHVGGASYGGTIAFEIARQLHEQGEKVGIVALFDSYGPGYIKFLPGITKVQLAIDQVRRKFEHHTGSIMMLESGTRMDYLREKLSKAKMRAKRLFIYRRKAVQRKVYTAMGKSLPNHLVASKTAMTKARMSFVPQPYPGKVTLFRASHQPRGIYPDPTLGWGPLALGGIEIHEVAGFHGDIITEPRVRYTVVPLRECLERAYAEAHETAKDEPRSEGSEKAAASSAGAGVF